MLFFSLLAAKLSFVSFVAHLCFLILSISRSLVLSFSVSPSLSLTLFFLYLPLSFPFPSLLALPLTIFLTCQAKDRNACSIITYLICFSLERHSLTALGPCIRFFFPCQPLLRPRCTIFFLRFNCIILLQLFMSSTFLQAQYTVHSILLATDLASRTFLILIIVFCLQLFSLFFLSYRFLLLALFHTLCTLRALARSAPDAELVPLSPEECIFAQGLASFSRNMR